MQADRDALASCEPGAQSRVRPRSTSLTAAGSRRSRGAVPPLPIDPAGFVCVSQSTDLEASHEVRVM